jgi:hypothetical protein
MGRKETTMNLKKIAWTATLAGALGAATLGLGAGSAQAQPKSNPHPVVPSNTDFNQPPGHIGQDLGIPPGQFKKIPTISVELPDGTITDPIENPFYLIPPGHWRHTPFEVTAAPTG